MNLSRRELLGSFLGAAIANAACRSNTAHRFPDGEIVGQSTELGHILRTPTNYEVPFDNWERKKVVIVGGGIAGLTAAWKLKKENFNDFVVLELEKEAGGTS
ncbi:MAG: FAD-dependent oxidoreductase, partial [Pyrinomonadaceae bacterium]|nr:FAD-dependent oxidoreductase [Pyrinomonadaceae bacterium]